MNLVQRNHFLFIPVFFCLICLVQIGLAQQNIKTDLQNENLKGNVRLIVVKTFSLNTGTKPQNPDRVDSSFYNKHGNLLREISRGPAKDDLYLALYCYDEKGTNLLRETDIDNGDTLSMASYTYNSAGVCIAQEEFDYEDSSVFRQTFSYDAKGNCTKVTYDYSEVIPPVYDVPPFHNQLINTFDSLGRLLRSETFESSGILATSQVSTWTNLGKTTVSRNKANYFNVTFSDNANRMLSFISYNPDSSIIRTSNYSWDKYGNLLSLKIFRSDGTLENEYQNVYTAFDKKHNWCRMLRKDNGAQVILIERRLQYY